MTNSPPSTITTIVQKFADDVTRKFASQAEFNPEDQLKGPVSNLFTALGKERGRTLETITEVQVSEVSGRPDVGIIAKSLLTGHVELKAPGKGADPERLKGPDHKQWEKFKDLPNLIYTDGNEWTLYRTGKRVGALVHFSADVTQDGKAAVTAAEAEALAKLIDDFLLWKPIVPTSPRALANLIAPLCRLLRADVLAALQNPESNLSILADEWRLYLFPDADNEQFADAYAQTLTYALLLAQLSREGAGISVSTAAQTIRSGHRLLADTLNILDKAREEIEAPVALLERVIAEVDPDQLAKKSKGDVWLYFYEDFLAAYDPEMRKHRGVYYTPVEVVLLQVRLVAELLQKYFDADYAYVSENVVTLDPVVGTGTYILTALQHGLDQVEQAKGRGMRANAATQAAKNLYAFELLVGPYTVAHLRLTQQIVGEGGQLPPDGVHVYLTDTLESPNQPPPRFPFMYKELAEEHKRAQKVKATVPVLVCLGNPPYNRQLIAAEDEADVKRKGGWVRFGDEGDEGESILRDFIAPLEPLGLGVHAKNLYNDYVYFWRWALWKVFEGQTQRGVVSFITASSYLRGPGFAGMRQVMRQTFDDLWIIDLEGDNLGARKSENVFAIQTPVAIAIGVRYDKPQPLKPAAVYYVPIDGTAEEKLHKLAAIESFKDLKWRTCLSGWIDPFLPTSDKPYWDWPLLTDLLPWQENGMQFKRTWPIGTTREVLERRWKALLSATNRSVAFKETRDRKIKKQYPSLEEPSTRATALDKLDTHAPTPPQTKYAFRSFDRRWVLLDNRLGDYLRPSIRFAHGDKQIYLTSLLTKVLGAGPAGVGTCLIPDLDCFCNRGAKDIIPLWRNREATEANITLGVQGVLAKTYGKSVSPEDFFAYCYAILATPEYVRRFWDELTIPGPRIPITKNPEVFRQAVKLGKNLIWLHTFGERFVPKGKNAGKLPPGKARSKVGTPSDPEDYPTTYSYDAATQELHVGSGVFEHVRPKVWAFTVSGLYVVKSWLAYRVRDGAGRKSSPLDSIRPTVWQFDEELLDLLWVLDATIDLLPSVAEVFSNILKSKIFKASELPQPTAQERKALIGALPLFGQMGLEAQQDEAEER